MNLVLCLTKIKHRCQTTDLSPMDFKGFATPGPPDSPSRTNRSNRHRPTSALAGEIDRFRVPGWWLDQEPPARPGEAAFFEGEAKVGAVANVQNNSQKKTTLGLLAIEYLGFVQYSFGI